MDITIVNGVINQLTTGGAHIVVFWGQDSGKGKAKDLPAKCSVSGTCSLQTNLVIPEGFSRTFGEYLGKANANR